MTNMDLFKILANFLLFFKPLPSNQGIPIEKKSTYYPTYAHQVVGILKQEVEKEYNVHCCAVGGSMPYDIMEIDVWFQTMQPASVELARELIVNINKKFYRIINSDENIRPFLREYPFPIERLDILIQFDEFVKNTVSNNQIKCVSHTNGNISYLQDDETGHKYVAFYKESYGEALKIVQSTLTE